MVSISIIGFGNVAQHLAKALSKSPEIQLIQIYSRSRKKVPKGILAPVVNHLEELLPADLYLICVADDAIATLSESLAFSGKLVAHTAGALSFTVLSDTNRRAVFYPFQSFSKNHEIEFSEVPICLDCEIQSDYVILEKVAAALSAKSYKISSDQRKALHVCGVFVNNFSNYMYRIAADICQEQQLPFELLLPLISETANKVKELAPTEAQTGPANRGDQKTIASHLEFLKSDKHKKIYQLLSEFIENERKKL